MKAVTRRRKMGRRGTCLACVVVILALVAFGAFTEDKPAYNLRITDGQEGLIASFDRIALVAFDPTTGDQASEPTLVLDQARDPIEAKVPEGHYLVMVSVDWLPIAIPFASVEVQDQILSLLDLRELPFNLRITDEHLGLIESFDWLSLVEYDPVSGKPAERPSLLVKHPTDPIDRRVLDGHYWLMVGVKWLASPVAFASVEVADGRVCVLDLMALPLPDELMTY
jgi:hypothetical protein